MLAKIMLKSLLCLCCGEQFIRSRQPTYKCYALSLGKRDAPSKMRMSIAECLFICLWIHWTVPSAAITIASLLQLPGQVLLSDISRNDCRKHLVYLFKKLWIDLYPGIFMSGITASSCHCHCLMTPTRHWWSEENV